MKKLPFFLVLMTTFLSSGLLTKVNNDNTLINNQVVQKRAINTNVLETSFNETTKHDTNVLSPVFINTFIDSLDSLINYSNDESIRPSNVILRVNSVLMLVDENGKLLTNSTYSNGLSFKDAYDTFIKTKMLPVIYFNDANTKDALINFLNNTMCPIDMAVCSSNAELLNEVRSKDNGEAIRGIYDVSNNNQITKEEMVKIANSSYANTIILNDSQASEETIRYLESRFKSVWVINSEYSDLEIARLITDGVYGIVTSNVSEAINVFEYFNDTENKLYNVNRPAFNIAHRGNPITNYTNSLEGFIESYEKGATHIELDVMTTKDNKLVIMHDSELSISTNGRGNVADLTSEEIKQYKITKNANQMVIGDGVEIPFLDDVFKEFKGNGKIIVVEIKDSNVNTVNNLKTYLDEYDMYDQVVCIAFDNAQLVRCKEIIPEVPCATLNNMSESMFNDPSGLGVISLNRNNYSNDFNKGVFNENFDFNLAERGFLGFYWTYSNIAEIYTGINNGVLGITNDYCTTFETFPTKLLSPEDLVLSSIDELDEKTFELNYLQYNGEVSEKTIESKAFITRNNNDGTVSAILSGYFLGPNGSPRYRGTYFTDEVIFKVNSSSSDDTNGDNNLGLILGISIPVGVILIGSGIAIPLILKKKKEKNN